MANVFLSRIFYALGVMFILTGCATISYDAQADQQITALTQYSNEELFTWESKAKDSSTPVTYKPDFYDKFSANATTLELRMEATQDESTERLMEIFTDIQRQIDSMRALHKDENTLSAPYIKAQRTLLNVKLSILTTYELSLKGKASDSTTAKVTSTSTKSATKAASTN